MKTIIFFILTLAVLSGCNKDDVDSSQPIVYSFTVYHPDRKPFSVQLWYGASKLEFVEELSNVSGFATSVIIKHNQVLYIQHSYDVPLRFDFTLDNRKVSRDLEPGIVNHIDLNKLF